MRRLLLVLAACSSTKPAPAPVTGSGSATAAIATLEDVVSARAVGIARFKPAMFFPLIYARELLGNTAPCWEALEKALVAGYQIERDVVPRKSYFVLEGDLPRAEVIACIPRAIQNAHVTAKLDGDLVAFTIGEDPDHPAYAGWRGRFVVLGTKQEVTDALASPTAESRAGWRAETKVLPATSTVWMARRDALMSNLFGVETAHYAMLLDTSDSKGFTGRVIATYRNAGDAAVAARRIKEGDLQTKIDAPLTLVTSFKRMIVRQDGATVELAFNLDTFGGLSVDELQQWFVKLTGS